MQSEDAETIHIGNQEGAINTNNSSSIAVDLQAKGRAAVTANGTNKEHNLYSSASGSRNTDDTTAWTTTWKGTWAIAKDTLTLDLTLEKHDCKMEREEDGRVEPHGTCNTPSQTAKLTCATQKISIEKDAKAHDIEGWACTPSAKTGLAESGGTWMFGKKQCVKRRGGHMTPFSWVDC
jgi:hypothetical protein